MFCNKDGEEHYTTIYGGIAVNRGGDVVFIEEPDQDNPKSVGYIAGCGVPVDWNLIPKNEAAYKRIANRDNQYP